MPSRVTMPPLVFCKKTCPAPFCGDGHSLGNHENQLARCNLGCDHALTATILDNEVYTEIFVEAPDRRMFDRGLKKGVKDVEAALICREPRALNLRSAERPHVDKAIRFSAPGTTPVLEVNHFGGAMGDEILDHVLRAQPVSAGEGVVEMRIKRIVRLHNTRRCRLRPPPCGCASGKP